MKEGGMTCLHTPKDVVVPDLALHEGGKGGITGPGLTWYALANESLNEPTMTAEK